MNRKQAPFGNTSSYSQDPSTKLIEFPLKWPKISVIVPSFNQGQFLERTLRSIVQQQYPNLELIVIDGGSTDNSVEIIRKYENFIDYWVSEVDGSQTQGLIKGFNQATGDILCWLNSDDLYEKDTLFEVGSYFRSHPDADALYGGTTYIDENDRVMFVRKEFSFNDYMLFYSGNFIPSPSMFWRRNIYDHVGGLDTDFDLAMDADLWIRFHKAGGKIGYIPKLVSRTRFYPACKTARMRRQTKTEFHSIFRRYNHHISTLPFLCNTVYAKMLRLMRLILANPNPVHCFNLMMFILKDTMLFSKLFLGRFVRS